MPIKKENIMSSEDYYTSILKFLKVKGDDLTLTTKYDFFNSDYLEQFASQGINIRLPGDDGPVEHPLTYNLIIYFINFIKNFGLADGFININKELEFLNNEGNFCIRSKSATYGNILNRKSNGTVNLINLLETNYYDKNVMDNMACLISSIAYLPPPRSLSGSTPNFDQYKKRIKENIINSSILASGGYGVALLSSFAKAVNSLIIKITLRDEQEIIHELVIGSVLNNLREWIPNFTYVYGGFSCGKARDLKTINASNRKNVEICTNDPYNSTYAVYENITNSIPLVDFLIENPNFTFVDVLSIYLQILYSLDLAHKMYDFTHYDLHTGNILIRDWSDEYKYIPYPNKDGTFDYVKSRGIATIIDYGQSHVKVNDINYGLNIIRNGTKGMNSFPMEDAHKLLLYMIDHLSYNKKNKNLKNIETGLRSLYRFFNDTANYNADIDRIIYFENLVKTVNEFTKLNDYLYNEKKRRDEERKAGKSVSYNQQYEQAKGQFNQIIKDAEDMGLELSNIQKEIKKESERRAARGQGFNPENMYKTFYTIPYLPNIGKIVHEDFINYIKTNVNNIKNVIFSEDSIPNKTQILTCETKTDCQTDQNFESDILDTSFGSEIDNYIREYRKNDEVGRLSGPMISFKNSINRGYTQYIAKKIEWLSSLYKDLPPIPNFNDQNSYGKLLKFNIFSYKLSDIVDKYIDYNRKVNVLLETAVLLELNEDNVSSLNTSKSNLMIFKNNSLNTRYVYLNEVLSKLSGSPDEDTKDALLKTVALLTAKIFSINNPQQNILV